MSGSYSHSSSKDYHKSTFDGGTLTIPGIQIIAWVSEITPASPPENAPVQETTETADAPAV